ncbi:MAG: A/G-specific adenine glycosylase [Defluviitaleaceae bacterium]|nr:A/G-specific adenine glycosylase [Defluviitaleaceae bacterium]MCL2275426.1 A/G-specific adenine glycosylase [Defluviitaleaceae bacterium]
MQKNLLTWYAKHKRDLPWRSNPTPYAVLISEVMAQQTRLGQLLPFYMRFMTQFPTIEALAASTEDAVLAAWAGMGYYARARNLHHTAREICEKHGGVFPQTRKEWEALSGIGAYTAGAILAIAFGQKETAIDGNVLRLYARLANDETDISTTTAKHRAAEYVSAYMPHTSDKIRAFTQALMELGALVCIPSNPRCESCPISNFCEAYKAGNERNLPVKARKKASPVIPLTVLRIFAPQGRVLMRKRTEGLLKGMWVYYLIEETPEKPSRTPAEITEYLAKTRGYTVTHIEPLGEARHTFTHRVWHMHGYDVHIKENYLIADYHFISPDDMKNIALPAAMGYFIAK